MAQRSREGRGGFGKTINPHRSQLESVHISPIDFTNQCNARYIFIREVAMTRKFTTCLAGLSLAASLVAVSAIPLVSALAQGQDAPPAAQAPAAPAAPQTPAAPARFDD